MSWGSSCNQSQETLEVHCNNRIVTLTSQNQEEFSILQCPRVMQHVSIMWTINSILWRVIKDVYRQQGVNYVWKPAQPTHTSLFGVMREGLVASGEVLDKSWKTHQSPVQALSIYQDFLSCTKETHNTCNTCHLKETAYKSDFQTQVAVKWPMIRRCWNWNCVGSLILVCSQTWLSFYNMVFNYRIIIIFPTKYLLHSRARN